MKAKKLIEVALPIKEISAESVRDKYVHTGHLSTLHIWWARRPLPLCRAAVFASLVPDPLDEHCPVAFKDAIISLVQKASGTPYKTYKDIPYTAIVDPMEDNLRNSLLMFIGKFSDKCASDMLSGKSTPQKELVSDFSLIKCEARFDKNVLRIARELIWVAYNSEKDTSLSYEYLHNMFNEVYDAIVEAEDALYNVPDRHIKTSEIEELENNLQTAIENFQVQMPSVFDPFAGGGAIPMEAARLGCRSFGNDINPVAHIIERCSAEFPQTYGKPIYYSEQEFNNRYGVDGVKFAHSKGIYVNTQGYYYIPNRLSFDVEYYAVKLLELTESEVGDLYQSTKKDCKPVVYYWARIAKCCNPSCGAEVPMLKQFYLANKTGKKTYLQPIISGNSITFKLANGKCNITGWNNRGNVTCPCCGNVITIDQVKAQSNSNGLNNRLLAYVYDLNGKTYEVADSSIDNYKLKHDIADLPKANMQRNSGGGDTFSWGITKWNELFTPRQLDVLTFLADNVRRVIDVKNEYDKIVATYLALFVDRVCSFSSSFGRWIPQNEQLTSLFGRQAIAMNSDFPEINIFSKSTSGAYNQLDWIVNFIDAESQMPFKAIFKNASSGERSQFDKKQLNAVVTDPPYYNAIAYADISDFFYMWLKRMIGDLYPINFSTPQTPKAEECTALKHHHDNDENKAKKHFENKLTEIFDAIEQQTSDVVSIMFAHQSTEAWTTLCNSILKARLNITGSWAIDSERDTRMVANAGAALESSVTVACRPSERKGYGDYKSVKKDIERKVSEEVESLYELGFRGADLLTACFGQAVSEFGKYKSVEKSDGSEVTVAELLEMARNAAFNALLKGVQGDDFTKFYIGWLQLNGTGETDFDDATKFTRVGVNVNIKDIQQEGLLILEGKKMHIAMADEHIGGSSVEGTRPEDSPISQAHRFILLNKEEDRGRILRFVRDICPEASSPLWRLLATLKELLPANDDQKQVVSILQNAEDFRQHCHEDYKPKEGNLFDNMDI